MGLRKPSNASGRIVIPYDTASLYRFFDVNKTGDSSRFLPNGNVQTLVNYSTKIDCDTTSPTGTLINSKTLIPSIPSNMGMRVYHPKRFSRHTTSVASPYYIYDFNGNLLEEITTIVNPSYYVLCKFDRTNFYIRFANNNSIQLVRSDGSVITSINATSPEGISQVSAKLITPDIALVSLGSSKFYMFSSNADTYELPNTPYYAHSLAASLNWREN